MNYIIYSNSGYHLKFKDYKYLSKIATAKNNVSCKRENCWCTSTNQSTSTDRILGRITPIIVWKAMFKGSEMLCLGRHFLQFTIINSLIVAKSITCSNFMFVEIFFPYWLFVFKETHVSIDLVDVLCYHLRIIMFF